MTTLFMDKCLAQRLERAEGAANAAMVTTRANMAPDSGAAWIEVAGTYAMFDSVGSPMTQSFGLGMYAEATEDALTQLEAFFRARGSEVHHETSPLAGAKLFATLAERGYRPIELSTVLVQSLAELRELPPSGSGPRVRIAQEADREVWSATATAGWAQQPEYVAFIRDLVSLTFANPSSVKFIAENDENEPMATGSLVMHEGVALLAGASTEPKHRSRGAQGALLAVRLAHARASGCDLAMMVTEPGSTSQRNAERHGFRVAYTRTKWALS